MVAAIVAGHSEVALYLLRNGADPKLKSYFDDLTPLEAATRYNDAAVLAYLAELGISSSWWRRIIKRLRRV